MALRSRPLDGSEADLVRGILATSALADLFFGLATYEQRHALRVCRTLLEGGYGDDTDLLQAALLHDLGKRDPHTGRSVTLWGKVANVVLVKTGGRKLVQKVASPNPASWRYIFWLQLNHEEQGEYLVRQAGSSERVATLVRGGPDPALALLKWADDRN